MALARKWQELYQAEIVSVYTTIISIGIAANPSDMAKAFEFAKEIEALAPCTTQLTGMSLIDIAAVLLKTKQLELHEEP